MASKPWTSWHSSGSEDTHSHGSGLCLPPISTELVSCWSHVLESSWWHRHCCLTSIPGSSSNWPLTVSATTYSLISNLRYLMTLNFVGKKIKIGIQVDHGVEIYHGDIWGWNRYFIMDRWHKSQKPKIKISYILFCWRWKSLTSDDFLPVSSLLFSLLSFLLPLTSFLPSSIRTKTPWPSALDSILSSDFTFFYAREHGLSLVDRFFKLAEMSKCPLASKNAAMNTSIPMPGRKCQSS